MRNSKWKRVTFRNTVRYGTGILLGLLAVALPVFAQSSTSPVPPAIVSGVLTGSPYAQTLAAIGTGPITWSVTGGTLPPGLVLTSSRGLTSRTPTTPVAFTFSGGEGRARRPPTAPSIVTTSPLPAAVTGSAYTWTISATGTAPITWSITNGTLPAGLSLAPSTGIISGTPTAAGVFTPTITATNAGGANSNS